MTTKEVNDLRGILKDELLSKLLGVPPGRLGRFNTGSEPLLLGENLRLESVRSKVDKLFAEGKNVHEIRQIIAAEAGIDLTALHHRDPDHPKIAAVSSGAMSLVTLLSGRRGLQVR